MSRAVVNSPENAPSIHARQSGHDLVDQASEGVDAVFGLTASEDPGVVDIQGSQLDPGATAFVLMLYSHGRIGSTQRRGTCANSCLGACFFMYGDDKLTIFQRFAIFQMHW
jgi:hypothetical protein